MHIHNTRPHSHRGRAFRWGLDTGGTGCMRSSRIATFLQTKGKTYRNTSSSEDVVIKRCLLLLDMYLLLSYRFPGLLLEMPNNSLNQTLRASLIKVIFFFFKNSAYFLHYIFLCICLCLCNCWISCALHSFPTRLSFPCRLCCREQSSHFCG